MSSDTIPTKDEIENLYYNEKLNFMEIYQTFRDIISRRKLKELFKAYNIDTQKDIIKQTLTKEVLTEEYLLKNNTIESISKKYNTSLKTVRKKLKQFNIYEKPDITTKEELEQLYFIEQLSTLDIAKKFGYSTPNPVRLLFKKYNINPDERDNKNILHDKKLKQHINDITKEQIETLYHNNNYKLTDLHKTLNISRRLFIELFKYYGIEKINPLKKEKPIKPPKELLIDKPTLEKLYNEDLLSLTDISKMYNLKNNTRIRNLCKKYKIPIRTSIEACQIKLQKEDKSIKIPKKELEILLNKYSVTEICKIRHISKTKLNRWINEYNIDKNYFKNLHIKEALREEDNKLSAKELSLKYNVTVGVIKQFKKNFISFIYTIQEIKEKIELYNYDMNNRGFSKQLFHDDKNLYDSIIYHTKHHKLKTNKITEKLYRILNDYDANQINCCTHCNTELNFYTMQIGYGNSDIQICSKCLAKHNGFGVSRVSQKLFWKIFDSLEDKSNCYFNDLNHELKIEITEEDKISYKDDIEHLNKRVYNIDFVYNNKIIEFDGRYWHKSEKSIKKDKIKDKFLVDRGYKILRIPEEEYTKTPEQVIEKCLTFLTQ